MRLAFPNILELIFAFNNKLILFSIKNIRGFSRRYFPNSKLSANRKRSVVPARGAEAVFQTDIDHMSEIVVGHQIRIQAIAGADRIHEKGKRQLGVRHRSPIATPGPNPARDDAR